MTETTLAKARELRISYLPRTDITWDGRKSLTSPRDAAEILTTILRNEAVEVFGVLCLTTKHRPVCYHELARGVLDASIVHPRELFKAAILANAAAVVVGHNHPSGDPEPSPEDVRLTHRLVAAGVLLGIDVLDHVIVGSDSYFSFREKGQL